jgi:hypothetical protein
LLSIFINVSSDNPKFLVFYEQPTEDCQKSNDPSSNLDYSDQHSDAESNKKRAKLGFDAFTKKLK